MPLSTRDAATEHDIMETITDEEMHEIVEMLTSGEIRTELAIDGKKLFYDEIMEKVLARDSTVMTIAYTYRYMQSQELESSMDLFADKYGVPADGEAFQNFHQERIAANKAQRIENRNIRAEADSVYAAELIEELKQAPQDLMHMIRRAGREMSTAQLIENIKRRTPEGLEKINARRAQIDSVERKRVKNARSVFAKIKDAIAGFKYRVEFEINNIVG